MLKEFVPTMTVTIVQYTCRNQLRNLLCKPILQFKTTNKNNCDHLL